MHDPVNAETRGRLRLYKQKLAANYDAFDAFTNNGAGRDRQLSDFVHKKGLGRQRGFDRLDARFRQCGARLQFKRLEGKEPLALWAILKPRDAVTVDPEHPRDAQDAVTVNYIFVGCTPDSPKGVWSEGLWTLEVTDHTLARAMWRGEVKDPTEMIFAAHHAVLGIDIDQLERETFLLSVGSGAWGCEIRAGHDRSLSYEPMVYVMARTFLDFDQLSPQQEAELVHASPKDKVLVRNVHLLPPDLRKLHVKDGMITVEATAAMWENRP